ncbi:TIGR03086 family metal-binding protein [Amycolatopsis sp. H20-H5]|uniref:TIGR03086 family metal-binding protein n=1 Tax=Amycolatopsis sp. H20-H5 TaxID=3046309 RepID=UPI002DBD31FA|nr:TIGR03086 family metal-binding protein [Amycolatopsis sp. H20-H5]MEC3979995.1 TIGR03086 family metal-binding protein [Amycolatopsis sp. H20-H5]
MELLDAHGEALQLFDRAVRAVGPEDWERATPCSEWTVRALVDHLVTEQLWAPPLLGGSTLDEVGGRFDGDVLGPDPLDAWTSASGAARAAWLRPGALRATVHVSTGLIPAEDYGWQMTADLAVHGWDLARAGGAANPIGPALADRLITELRPQIDAWQGIGFFAPPVAVPRYADAPTRLVALLGRTPR